MNGHYILDVDGNPVEADILTWAQYFGSQDRTIARTELPDGVTVSTVFLGLDHALGSGPPLLFETMIFGGPLDETQDRYSTRQSALDGHAYYVRAAQAEALPE